MSNRWPGGIIRKTPVTPSGGAASGVWSLADAAYWKKQGLWPTLPGAPTIGTATAGASSASVDFTAPTNTGTPSTITQYRVTSSPGAITATGASSPVTISGLTNGTSYTFTVAATNAAGTGPESASSNAVTPVDPNYVAVLKDGTDSLPNTGGDIDSSGNFYSVGYADIAGDKPIILTKYNSSGAIEFKYAYTWSGFNFTVSYCKVSSSGDIYIWSSTSNSSCVLIKLNSSGVVQWAQEVSLSGLEASTLYVSSGDIYAGGSKSNGAHLLSFTTSGSLNWVRRFSNSSRFGGLSGIVVTPSGYLYAGAYVNAGSSTNYAAMVRLDTSGNNVWIRAISASGRDYLLAIATDLSDNFYAAFYYEANPGYTRILKYDSNYNGISGISSASSGNYPYINNMYVDSSGNVYAYASQNFLFKFNSSLSQQFQRRVTGSSQAFNYGFMSVLGDRVYFNSNNRDNGLSKNNFFGMKVANDGTGTGSYTVAGISYSYASSTDYSWSAGGAPSTFNGAGQDTVSATLTARTITRSTPSYTQTVTTF